LKHYIQDLVDSGNIEVDSIATAKSPNESLGIFKDPFPNHDERKNPDQGQSSQNKN
ncbi:hypothetical protein KI387_042443, partial [Taxus chinensis]